MKSKNSLMPTKNFDISQAYDLIINSTDSKKTLMGNISLWKNFYNNYTSIIKNNIDDERLFMIIKFLLQYKNGKTFDYLPSKLLNCLNQNQTILCSRIKKSKTSPPIKMDILLTNLANYKEMCTFLEKNNFNQNNLTQESIKAYQNSSLKLDTLEGLLTNIYDNFFLLSPEIIHNIVNYIENNIICIKTSKNIKNGTYLNFVAQYLEKIIPIKHFIGKNLDTDPLIKNTIEGNIQNKEIIDKIFNTLDKETILEVFQKDIFRFLSFLEKQPKLDNTYKQTLMNKIADLLLTPKNFYILFPLMTKNSQNPYWINYLTPKKFEILVNYALGAPPFQLSFDSLNYLLDNNYINKLFLSNLKEFLTTSSISLSKQEKIILSKKLTDKLNKYNILTTPNLSQLHLSKEDSLEDKKIKSKNLLWYPITLNFNIAIELLDNYLQKKINIDIETLQVIITSIIKYMLTHLGITNTEVYFVKHQNYNGEYLSKYKNQQMTCINININLLEKFLTQNKPLSERIHLFITILHEMRHAKKEYDKTHQYYDIETYEMLKEEKLEKFDPNYYLSNYIYTKKEMDARTASYNMTAKFFQNNLPNHLDKVQDSIIQNLEKELLIKQKEIMEKVTIIKKKELNFHDSFDLLVKYNPKIIQENWIFELEYNKDGTPKSYEDMMTYQTEENKELIEAIIQKRNLLDSSIREESNKRK